MRFLNILVNVLVIVVFLGFCWGCFNIFLSIGEFEDIFVSCFLRLVGGVCVCLCEFYVF